MNAHNTSLTRFVLQQVIADVRKHDPEIKVSDAWVYKCGRDHWEFHFGKFYWHGSADNAYEARSAGWSAYLRKQGAPEYAA